MLKRIRVQNLSHVKLLNLPLERVSAHSFSEVILLRTYISIHKFRVICTSATFLNADTAFDYYNLKIEGHDIVRSDRTSSSRRGGVFIYYKQSLVFKILDTTYLQECIVFQVSVRNKLSHFISLYQSPSQTTDLFEHFADNLEFTLDKVAGHNSFLIVV